MVFINKVDIYDKYNDNYSIMINIFIKTFGFTKTFLHTFTKIQILNIYKSG